MILDRQAALERIEYDQGLYDDICEIFRNDAPNMIAQLRSAYGSGDIPTATRHAHSLKSAAASIGASDLTETARRAESTLRTADLGDMDTLLSAIDQHLELVLKALV